MPPSVACRVGAGSCWLVQGVMELLAAAWLERRLCRHMPASGLESDR